jgi:hypothetical protein
MTLRKLVRNWKRIIVPSSIRDWWLERQINAEFAEKIKDTRAKKDHNEVRKLEHERWWNLTDVGDSRQARIQQKWIGKHEN